MSHKITKINKIPLQSLLGYGLNDQYECHTVLYTGSFISVVFWRDIDLSVLLYGMLMEWIRPHFVILESWIECLSFMYTGVLKIGSDLLEIGAWKELLKIDSILLSWEVGLNAVVYVLGIEEWIWPFGMWSMDRCWYKYYPTDIYTCQKTACKISRNEWKWSCSVLVAELCEGVRTQGEEFRSTENCWEFIVCMKENPTRISCPRSPKKLRFDLRTKSCVEDPTCI